MKRFNLKLKDNAWRFRFTKVAWALLILLALDSTISFNAYARHGGRGFGGYGRGYYGGFYGGYSINRFRPYYYAHYPRWGYYYDVIPSYELQFLLNGVTYYYGNGIYYRVDNGKYVETAAPIGYRTKVLPKNCLQFTLDNITYYYDFGTFYTERNGQYEVVRAPLGAVIDILPDGADKVIIEGQTYYTLNGVQYKAVTRNNEIWYEVIKS